MILDAIFGGFTGKAINEIVDIYRNKLGEKFSQKEEVEFTNFTSDILNLSENFSFIISKIGLSASFSNAKNELGITTEIPHFAMTHNVPEKNEIKHAYQLYRAMQTLNKDLGEGIIIDKSSSKSRIKTFSEHLEQLIRHFKLLLQQSSLNTGLPNSIRINCYSVLNSPAFLRWLDIDFDSFDNKDREITSDVILYIESSISLSLFR